MSRKLRSLVALATVGLIGAGGSYSLAANGNTGSKGSSLAPGTLPPKGSSGSRGSLSAPGTLPPKGSSGSKGSLSAPGTLPPKGSSR
jgi:hypothetical protein